MNWEAIKSEEDVLNIISKSKNHPQLIFKHSLTCPISGMAKLRVEDRWNELNGKVDFHYLDLLNYREVSNFIASHLKVHHESPQSILIIDGEVIHDASHMGITIGEIKEALEYIHG